jgi:hypothetical protein
MSEGTHVNLKCIEQVIFEQDIFYKGFCSDDNNFPLSDNNQLLATMI